MLQTPQTHRVELEVVPVSYISLSALVVFVVIFFCKIESLICGTLCLHLLTSEALLHSEDQYP